MITIDRVDHVGIRVADLDRATAFYEIFGFKQIRAAGNDDVVVMKNDVDVEINIIFNSNNSNNDKNILMDVPDKYPGFTHVAFRVGSIAATVATLNGIAARWEPAGSSGTASARLRRMAGSPSCPSRSPRTASRRPTAPGLRCPCARCHT